MSLSVALSLFVIGSRGPLAQDRAALDRQPSQYDANVPKTIVELQPFRETSSIRIGSPGGREGLATLINLHPAINAWYLLTVAWKGERSEQSYHLENPRPDQRTLRLDAAYPSGLVVDEGGHRTLCPLFDRERSNELERASGSRLVFYPACESRFYVRQAATGRRTTLEAATDFLRNQVWGGELVIDMGHHLAGGLHRETGELERASTPGEPDAGSTSERPRPAEIDPVSADMVVTSANLGIRLAGRPEGSPLRPGAWYAAEGHRGVHVSILRPDLIAPQILRSYPALVRPLDGMEASALCFLVAFDLDEVSVAYALGTRHPTVGWSEHIQPQTRDPALPGPDGIGSIAPLVSTGLVSPEDVPGTIAAFTGGFKREHGAFKFGALAEQHHGSHYGFIEHGVVFSKLQPGLSTLVVLNDGSVDLKTWREHDNSLLPVVKYARQNGVPLIEFDKKTQSSAPGPSVAQWGAGNWSGSENGKLRTIRAGLALQRVGSKRYLLYAVFTDATPSAMARVFQAYMCRYAMLLDMNALEHTYLAMFRRSGSHMEINHLIKGMAQVDRSSGGQSIPRFVGYPDNRDFFYVVEKSTTRRRP